MIEIDMIMKMLLLKWTWIVEGNKRKEKVKRLFQTREKKNIQILQVSPSNKYEVGQIHLEKLRPV